jgi:hypothetical protein
MSIVRATQSQSMPSIGDMTGTPESLSKVLIKCIKSGKQRRPTQHRAATISCRTLSGTFPFAAKGFTETPTPSTRMPMACMQPTSPPALLTPLPVRMPRQIAALHRVIFESKDILRAIRNPMSSGSMRACLTLTTVCRSTDVPNGATSIMMSTIGSIAGSTKKHDDGRSK